MAQFKDGMVDKPDNIFLYEKGISAAKLDVENGNIDDIPCALQLFEVDPPSDDFQRGYQKYLINMAKKKLVIDLILVSENSDGSNPEIYDSFIYPEFDDGCCSINGASEEYPWVRMVTVTTKV
jgi:hypothetical protein|tara:strand:- start:94 stop:462 length:369 start_codon:yes stop_codon:yes gene_type:complete